MLPKLVMVRYYGTHSATVTHLQDRTLPAGSQTIVGAVMAH